MIPVMGGLAAAHAVGVHFKNLTPDRIILVPDGEGARMVGLGARALVPPSIALDPDPASAYLAPEQIADVNGGDARSDIWALGVLMFELLAGQTPFTGETTKALRGAIMSSPVPSITGLTTISPGLAGIISRCLQKRLGDRYATASDLLSDLLSLLRASQRGLVAAAPVSQDPAELAARHAPTARTVASSGDAPRHAPTQVMADAPPRFVAPPGRAAPLELRTRFAYEATAFAELFASVVGRMHLPPHSYTGTLTRPEGPSTGAGARARQHLKLESPDPSCGAVVVGWVDLRQKAAELRAFALVDRDYERRFKRKLQLYSGAYAMFLARTIGFLEAAHLKVTILESEPEPEQKWGAWAGFAAGAVVIAILLVVVILALR
jgi:hypothetical protein